MISNNKHIGIYKKTTSDLERGYNRMKNTVMTDEARAARNKYMREWRAQNKDKERANRAAYWNKKAALEAQKTAESGKSEG